MAMQLAVKLAITAAALECTTRKELARAFARADPATTFDLDRSYKWLQGRARPRDPRLYAEWLALLRLDKSRTWLLESTPQEFLVSVAKGFGVDSEHLWQQASAFLGEDGDQPGSPLSLRHQLEGVYTAYSWAWSPYYAGRVIRGTLRVAASGKLGHPDVTYSEMLQGVLTRMQGTTYESGRLLFLNLLHEEGELPLFFSLFRPTPPVSLMLGHLAGAALVGPDPRPSVSRILMLRVPAAFDRVEMSNRYLEPDEEIVADLRLLGLSLPQELEKDLQAFLHQESARTLDQVPTETLIRLTSALDPLWLKEASAAR